MSVEVLPCIFFDTNVGDHDDGYRLILDQSRKDLAALGKRPRDGKEVLIRMPDELEMVAKLRFEEADASWEAHWVADSLEGTIKYLD